jgi:hypothetical protein
MMGAAKLFSALAISLFAATAGLAAEGPGLLRAKFVYEPDLSDEPLAANCTRRGERTLPPILTDIAVTLAGKVTESLIEAAAAKTQPEATTLETVIPLPGFYGASDVAIADACLVIHNGNDDRANGATFKAVWQVVVAPDNTAFRFNVVEWNFSRFLKPTTDSWFQKAGIRDLVLKIEFLSPSQDNLGTRSVFVEHQFIAVDADSLAKAFIKGQQLPWFASPTRSASSNAKGLNVPLNVKITLVETTKPNQFAVWTQEIAREKKADVTALVKDAVRRSLDPVFDATEGAKKADTAGTAYVSYKAAWDALAAQQGTKPVDPPAGADAAAQAAYKAALNAWQASMTVGRQTLEARKVATKAAFSAAGLPWPGDLPAL